MTEFRRGDMEAANRRLVDHLLREEAKARAMNDKVPHHMALSVGLAGKARVKNRALYEVREAFKSIVGAIKGAGNLDKLGSAQSRVVLEAAKTAWDHAEEQLDKLDYMEWEEVRYGNSNKDD